MLSAQLDGETKVLTGQASVSWTNRSNDEVADAWFHLYWNAFANNRSTHLTESKGMLRDHEIEEGWGWSRVTSVAAVDASGTRVDLMPTFRYRRPDDGNEEDRTVFSVDLPAAVAPGASFTLELEWESQIPRVRRRAGYKDDFLLAAHWFPKLGVYENGRGWNCHQFHMNTEFFSDYGTYDVELDLPPEYHGKVFGSGRLESETIKLGRNIARFFAPSKLDRGRSDAFGEAPVVHGFTWTADPRFVAKTTTFEPSAWIDRFPDEVAFAREHLGDEAIELRRVDVTTLMHPERSDQAERHFEATSAALFFYGLWFGEYPYEHITVIDPPWGGRAAGGMEYPTLFTSGTRLFTTEDMYQPESVTVHEAGHQFWYGLVGNNEFEAAWLDEGFNSYTDSEVLWRVYGPRRGTTTYAAVPVDGVPLASLDADGKMGQLLSLREIPAPFGLPVRPVQSSGLLDWWRDQPAFTFVRSWSDPRWNDRTRYLGDAGSDPIDTWAFEHVDRPSYGANSYPRTAVALRTLQHVVGDGPFLRGMRHFAEEWRYRHPYPDDFFRTFQEGAGVDCAWYFEEVFRTTHRGDWQVEVDQRRSPGDLGLFQGEGGEFLERPALDDEGGDDDAPWQVEVTLRRDGALSLPIPLRLTFDDGTVHELVWTREEQLERAWKRLSFEGDAKLISAQLDPNRRVFLDADVSNNAWYDAVDPVTPWRWGERVLAQVQTYLHWIGGLGG
ncbi:MAG: M1 family metallopeptidase [Planctomycetota bacterium]